MQGESRLPPADWTCPPSALLPTRKQSPPTQLWDTVPCQGMGQVSLGFSAFVLPFEVGALRQYTRPARPSRPQFPIWLGRGHTAPRLSIRAVVTVNVVMTVPGF